MYSLCGFSACAMTVYNPTDYKLYTVIYSHADILYRQTCIFPKALLQ